MREQKMSINLMKSTIDKNMFYVRTLDLSCRFEQIRRQLDDIALIAKNI